MASAIIAQFVNQSIAHGLEKRQDTGSDDFFGTKEDLIRAGLARDGQFPGDPGRGTTMVTYDANGNAVGKGCTLRQRAPEGMMEIRRAGGSRFCVLIRVSKDECARRLDASEPTRSRGAARDEQRFDESANPLHHSPARFNVGEKAIFWSEWFDDHREGMTVEIVGKYDLYRVRSEAGPFSDEAGTPYGHRWGYDGRDEDGDVSFYPAHSLRATDGSVRHLRLVKPRANANALA